MREIKILDIDNIFDDFLVKYIRENRGKFNEKEWEEKIPVLYLEFGNTELEELDGMTPEEYYKNVTPEQLADVLKKHVEQKVSVSDFLCESLIYTDCEEALSQFIDNEHDEELVSYCINILKDKNSTIAFSRYFKMLLDERTCDDMKELIAETLSDFPEDAKEGSLSCYENAGNNRIYLLEVFARCSHDDRIFEILMNELKEHKKDIPLYLSYVTKYGDEKALPQLLELIEDPAIDFASFRELKFAIELFGGEYTKKRDFSYDKTYKKIKEFKDETEDDTKKH